MKNCQLFSITATMWGVGITTANEKYAYICCIGGVTNLIAAAIYAWKEGE